MKHNLLIFTVCCFVVGAMVVPGSAAGLLEVGGVYEVPKGSVDFANGWGNALGVKMRLATRGSATDNLGLSFCYCQYPATNSQYDAKMMSLGLSQKSTFNDRARVRPYVKGEAGIMQALDVWETTIDPVTQLALHTKMRGGHTDWFLSAHSGFVFEIFEDYQIFAEVGFILTLQGERKKVLPFQVGIIIQP